MSLFAPANGNARLSLPEYLQLCSTHFFCYWKHYSIPLAVVLLLQLFIRIDVNYTESLPDHVFITVKGWKSDIQRGDYVAFAFPTENPVSPFRKGDHMVKIIGGVAGDKVEMTKDRGFQIIQPGQELFAATLGGDSMGISKTVSRMGKPLEAGPVGVIPEGHYYVFAPHIDSLDSRYAMVGWITKNDIIGRTFSLF
jgi:conjugal transfer pilin signal peptidase TrbI